MDLRLPELGEGITDATVVNVRVKPGDKVEPGQTLIEVETDKASMPIDAAQSETIKEVKVKPGDKIKVGTVLLVFAGAGSTNGSAAKPPAPAASQPTPSAPTPAPQQTASRYEFRLPTLGEGIDGGTVTGLLVKKGDRVSKEQSIISVETDKASMDVPIDAEGTVEELRVKPGDKIKVGSVIAVLSVSAAVPQASPVKQELPKQAAGTVPAKAMASVAAAPRDAGPASNNGNSVPNQLPVPAGPATRRLARELGLNLRDVPGSARGGRVTLDDVKGHVKQRMQQPASPTGGGVTAAPALPDFSKYGQIERKPVSNLRKKIAENLTIAWHTAPAVTQFDLADITDLEAGRKRIVEGLPKGTPKITMTVLAIKAAVAALKEFPNFNSSLDMSAGELIAKQYYHIGIAVDTERGLVVPVIRDADRKSIRDLAKEMNELADKARAGKLSIDDMRGGCFTITNLGGIGGTAFTPIINYPEVAILGLSRSSLQPVVRNCAIEIRLMMPLCLTYDHRVIDGADGARFTSRLTQLFSDPIRLLMES